MDCHLPRGSVNHIAWVTLSSPVTFKRLADEAALLAGREHGFGLVLEIDGINLDRHRELFPQIRHLSGGRARFGTWCRGVAYVFERPTYEAVASIHLEHAPRIWGTRICVARSGDEAVAWLAGQFDRYQLVG